MSNNSIFYILKHTGPFLGPWDRSARALHPLVPGWTDCSLGPVVVMGLFFAVILGLFPISEPFFPGSLAFLASLFCWNISFGSFLVSVNGRETSESYVVKIFYSSFNSDNRLAIYKTLSLKNFPSKFQRCFLFVF